MPPKKQPAKGSPAKGKKGKACEKSATGHGCCAKKATADS